MLLEIGNGGVLAVVDGKVTGGELAQLRSFVAGRLPLHCVVREEKELPPDLRAAATTYIVAEARSDTEDWYFGAEGARPWAARTGRAKTAAR